MKKLTLSIIVLFFGLEITAQTTIDKFPQNLQLYIREDNNTCSVPIEGSINETGLLATEIKLYRNNTLVLTDYRSPGNFSFELPLRAELAEYTIRLSKVKTSGTTQVRNAEKVLCGDVLLFYGQSNMAAIPGTDDFNATYSDQYMRTFDRLSSGDTTNFVWRHAKTPYASTGTIANYLMLSLIDSVKIPFLTINASVGGAQLWHLMERNPANHYDQNYTYGKLLSRLKKAGVINKLKFMAFLQGEAAAGNWYLDCNEYPGNFNAFINLIQNDLPAIKKFYEFQINIMSGTYIERAGFLRDFQRKTKDLYPGYVETLSTVGTEPYDGIHYGGTAYASKGVELSKLVLRDFYGGVSAPTIEHPSVEYAYYTPNKDSVILEFQKGQNLIYPASRNHGSYTRNMKDYIYFTNDNTTIYTNQSNRNVHSGTASGNVVKLRLNGSQNFNYMTYLPSTFSDSRSDYYNGPVIANTSNLKGFTFYCLPIANAPRVFSSSPKLPENFNVSSVSKSQINVSWRDVSPNNDVFHLEASTDSLAFTNVYLGNARYFKYIGLPSNKKHYFRIKSCNTSGCTPYSIIKSTTTYKEINYNCLDLKIKHSISNFTQNYHGKEITINSTVLNSILNLKANDSIEMLPGFSTNAVFSAMIESCPE